MADKYEIKRKQERFDQAVNSSSLSALAEIAVEDMEQLIKKRNYTPDCDTWVDFDSPKKCKACLAGAVMLFTNGVKSNEDFYMPTSWQEALESLRKGNVFPAYTTLFLLTHPLPFTDEYIKYEIIRKATREVFGFNYGVRFKHSKFTDNKQARLFVDELRGVIPKLRKVDERIAAGMAVHCK